VIIWQALGSHAATSSDKSEKFDASVPENDVSFDGSPSIDQFETMM